MTSWRVSRDFVCEFLTQDTSPSASQESAVVGIAFAMYGLRLAGDIKICRKVRFCGVAGDGGWLSAGWVYRVAVHSIT